MFCAVPTACIQDRDQSAISRAVGLAKRANRKRQMTQPGTQDRGCFIRVVKSKASTLGEVQPLGTTDLLRRLRGLDNNTRKRTHTWRKGGQVPERQTTLPILAGIGDSYRTVSFCPPDPAPQHYKHTKIQMPINRALMFNFGAMSYSCAPKHKRKRDLFPAINQLSVHGSAGGGVSLTRRA